MTRNQAIATLIQAFQAKLTSLKLPGLRDETARILAEEAVCALGGNLHLETQIAEMSGSMTGVSKFST